MSQTKKELVLSAFHNEPVERVPVGFWYHFLPDQRKVNALGKPEVFAANLDGLRQFYEAFQPDFIKIMSDGYFQYPNQTLANIKSVKSAAGIRPLGANHPWIEEQVNLVRAAVEAYGKEVLLFYNVFSAVRYLEFLQDAADTKAVFVELFKQDKAILKEVIDVIAEDLTALAKRVITEGGASGIYFSVQNNPKPEVTREVYHEIIAPSERKVLAAANAVSENNILHICGYEGCHNDLTWYQDYEATAINYAAVVEGIKLSEAKQLFNGKAIIGGLDNTENGVLYRGNRQEVEAATAAIIEDAGKLGIIIGADCTIPNDIDLERLNWVRDKAAAL